MDETVLKSESEDGELETCQQVNLNVVKVEDTSMDIKPPPDSVPGIISAPVCDISKPPYDCKLEPHADDTTPLLPPFLVPVCGVPQQSSSELPQVAPGQPLVMPLNPGGLVPLQPVCMVPGGSSTLGQPYFITPQGLSVQNVNPAYGPIHGVGFTLNGQCATLLSAAPGAQFVNSVVDAFRFQPSPAVPHTSTFPVVLDADPLTTVASTTVSSTSSTVVSAHTELGSTKGGPKKDDVLSRMDETELKSESEDGEPETCQQVNLNVVKVEDTSMDIKPPPDAVPGIMSSPVCDISTPPFDCKLEPHADDTIKSYKMDAWTTEETRAFIAIWSEEQIQRDLDGMKRNKKVFETIANRMKDIGHARNAEQCRLKIKKLKQDYRKIKDHNGKNGANRKTNTWFEPLDAVLGHRPTNTAAGNVVDSAGSVLSPVCGWKRTTGIDPTYSQVPPSPSLSSGSSSCSSVECHTPRTGVKRKRRRLETIVTMFKKVHEDQLAFEQRRLEVLQDLERCAAERDRELIRNLTDTNNRLLNVLGQLVQVISNNRGTNAQQ